MLVFCKITNCLKVEVLKNVTIYKSLINQTIILFSITRIICITFGLNGFHEIYDWSRLLSYLGYEKVKDQTESVFLKDVTTCCSHIVNLVKRLILHTAVEKCGGVAWLTRPSLCLGNANASVVIGGAVEAPSAFKLVSAYPVTKG